MGTGGSNSSSGNNNNYSGGGVGCKNDPGCKVDIEKDDYDWGSGYTTPDIPGRCDRPHCYDEREKGFPPIVTVEWKSWDEIDKFDLGVDAFGVLGDLLLTFGGPPGAIVWFGSEVLEVMTVSKNFDQMELGNPTAGVQVVVDVLGAGVDTARLAPWGGSVANLVSIGLNITKIEIYEPKPWPR